MNQKLAALLATALTAFLLVVLGGVVAGVATHRAAPATSVPATASALAIPVPPLANQDPVLSPDQTWQTTGPVDGPSDGEDRRWPGEREHHDEHDDDDD
ncbi:MAG: hypothetical protein U0232_03210 [Thermomicrobiales bacterium]